MNIQYFNNNNELFSGYGFEYCGAKFILQAIPQLLRGALSGLKEL
jgi:NADH:ubiquinone oxidoreductase subunit H